MAFVDDEVQKAAVDEWDWLRLMSLVSIVYGLILLLVFLNITKGWELEPNEMGDLLAGVFAPLAFLWLVTAVVVQSKELRAQRNELELSRNIAIQSKSVAEYQAKAADLQAQAAERNATAADLNAKAADTQNRLIEDQLAAQKKAYIAAEFSETLNQLHTVLVAQIANEVTIYDEGGESAFILSFQTISTDRDHALLQMGKGLAEAHGDRWGTLYHPSKNIIRSWHRRSVELCAEIVNLANEQIPYLSHQQLALVKAIDLNSFDKTLNAILEKCHPAGL